MEAGARGPGQEPRRPGRLCRSVGEKGSAGPGQAGLRGASARPKRFSSQRRLHLLPWDPGLPTHPLPARLQLQRRLARTRGDWHCEGTAHSGESRGVGASPLPPTGQAATSPRAGTSQGQRRAPREAPSPGCVRSPSHDGVGAPDIVRGSRGLCAHRPGSKVARAPSRWRERGAQHHGQRQ